MDFAGRSITLLAVLVPSSSSTLTVSILGVLTAVSVVAGALVWYSLRSSRTSRG